MQRRYKNNETLMEKGQQKLSTVITINAVLASLALVYNFIQLSMESLYCGALSGGIFAYFLSIAGWAVLSLYNPKLRTKAFVRRMKIITIGMLSWLVLGTAMMIILAKVLP